MAKSVSRVCVGNCCHAQKCVCVLKTVFFERIIWMSNHCANWKYIFMVDKLGIDQGGSSRRRHLVAGCFRLRRFLVRSLIRSEGD